MPPLLRDCSRALAGGCTRFTPALPAYLAAHWRAQDPAVYPDQRATATRCLLTAYAVFGRWLAKQIGSGDAGLALTIIDLQQRTMGQLLGYALQHEDWAEAEAIAMPLDSYWQARGHYAEADAWTDRVHAAVEGASDTTPGLGTPAGSLWLSFTGAQANRRVNSGQLSTAEETYTEILAVLQAQPMSTAAQPILAVTNHQLGLIAQLRGRLDEAADRYTQALAIERELGDRPFMANTYHQLGRVAQDRGRLDEAEGWYTHSLTIKKELGNRPGMADSYHQLGIVAQLSGRLVEAKTGISGP
jgi:tetratricopeptide (TPR) repeat protein